MNYTIKPNKIKIKKGKIPKNIKQNCSENYIFKKKIKFLFWILAGMVVGVLLFSKVMDFLLEFYEVPTRYAFLGLILGTVPFFFKEVKKKGFEKKYYAVIAVAFLAGLALFSLDLDVFDQVTNPNLIQKIVLGIGVAGSAIIPGVDPAVLLSTIGLYEIYVEALADFRLDILLPMLIGLVGGGIAISYLMTRLLRRFYTISFSVIFGVFLSMIPNMLNEECVLQFDLEAVVCAVTLIIGFLISYLFGTVEDRHPS